MGFLKTLAANIASKGKLSAAFLINEIPGITSTPGVVTAFHTAVHDHTTLSFADLGMQVIMAAIAIHTTAKVVTETVKTTVAQKS